MTTAICFDLDGTLLRFDEPYGDLLAGVLEGHLGTAGEAVVEAYDAAFFDAFADIEPEPVRAGMAAAVEAAGSDPADADLDAMAESLLDAECEAAFVPDGAREALAELGANARLGIITNGVADWQRTKLARNDLEEPFDAVVTSYEAGAHKPAVEPFDLAREQLPADEYAMVGDDYEADVEGARAAGFVPIHFEADEEGPGFWRTLRAML